MGVIFSGHRKSERKNPFLNAGVKPALVPAQAKCQAQGIAMLGAFVFPGENGCRN
jgi:hypothetical protein